MLLPYIVAFCVAYACILISHNALHWGTFSDFVSKFSLLMEEVTGALDLAGYPLDAACKICEEIAKTAKHPSMLEMPKHSITYSYPKYRKIRSLFPSDTIYRRHPPMSEVYQLCSLHSNSFAHRHFNVKPNYRDQSQLVKSHTRSVWAGYPPGTSRATEIIPIGYSQEPSSTWRTSIGVSSGQHSILPPASRTSLELKPVHASIFRDGIGVSLSSLLIP